MMSVALNKGSLTDKMTGSLNQELKEQNQMLRQRLAQLTASAGKGEDYFFSKKLLKGAGQVCMTDR